MIWIVDGLLVSGAAFLLLFGEHIAGRIQAARTASKEPKP